jgi:hypothetical protein
VYCACATELKDFSAFVSRAFNHWLTVFPLLEKNPVPVKENHKYIKGGLVVLSQAIFTADVS